MKLRPKPITKFPNKKIDRAGMVTIPPNLRPVQLLKYPADNQCTFEKWYMDVFSSADVRERLYLPIQWTALYCNNNFGACHKTKLQIQAFIDKLDNSKKYYTIVQYDDGILNNISGLDIKVFAMSGPRIDYPLPLISTPHQYTFPNEKRDIFASFIGRITHPIRTELVKQLQGREGYYISTQPHSMREYCHILARSKYALCPRGYGQTSFRIQEAIQYGAVPVYISDEFLIPYAPDNNYWKTELIRTGMHILHSEWTNDFDHFLKMIDVDYNNRIKELQDAKHLFTYTGCRDEILNVLKNENHEMQ